MAAAPKLVCVIGGGASGLTSVKSCLEYGLRPVCFEAEDSIGGLWRFTEDETHRLVHVHTTTKVLFCLV